MQEKILEVLHQIQSDVVELKITQQVILKDIEHHIKRTQIAEENIELLRAELKPVQDHVVQVNGIGKFLGISGIILAGIVSLIEILKLVK